MTLRRRKSGSENIVQSTQTELAFFLVIVFVMLLGFEVSERDKIAGSGDQGSSPFEVVGEPGEELGEEVRASLVPDDQGPDTTGSTAPPDKPDEALAPVARADSMAVPVVPEPPAPPPVEKKTDWQESADRALTRIKSCRVIRSEDSRSFVLPTDQLASDGQALTFDIGEGEVSDALWRNCLSELFQAVIATYLDHRDETRYIAIEGHTSSEWKNTVAGCTGVAGSADRARSSHVAFKCNRMLSIKRADAIFEVGYFFNSMWHQAGADHAIPSERFAELFRTEGRSSLDLVLDASGNEMMSDSRRVEFRFVGSSRAAEAQ